MDDKPRNGAEGELEELESIDDLEDSIDDSGIESSELSSDFLRILARSHNRGHVPLAICDSDLAIVHKNPLFKALIREYHYSKAAPFPSVFSEGFLSSSLDEVGRDLSDPAKSYYWEGKVEHRAKDRPNRLTKVKVQPFWSLDSIEAKDSTFDRPMAWSITVDDITLENKLSLRAHLESLLKASLQKDSDTGNHVKRVNLYSRRLAEELFRDPRWPEVDIDYIEEIGFLAAMHDIGKISTPDDILHKKGPLSEAEWRIMREHTINGAIILSPYPNIMAKVIARSHHEWWNGSGYPFNLVGSDIPLSARIVSLADVYDALRMTRSYKSGYSHAVAVEKMVEEKGNHFDPDLVGVFTRIGDSFARIYDEYKDVDPGKE